jgi:hypothetical protein
MRNSTDVYTFVVHTGILAYCYHHNCKNTATGIMEGVVRLSAKLVTDMFKGIMSLILVILLS